MKIIFTKNNQSFSRDEFKKLFDEHFEPLRDYVFYKCGNIEQAEDVAQEAFLKLWEKRSEIKKDTVLSYLFKIAHNIFLNQIKREQLNFNFQNQNTISGIEEKSPEYEMEFKEFNRKLEKALANLPEIYRVTFLLNRIDGLKYKEIAERLDVSIKTIEKRMQKALKILKEAIEFKL